MVENQPGLGVNVAQKAEDVAYRQLRSAFSSLIGVGDNKHLPKLARNLAWQGVAMTNRALDQLENTWFAKLAKEGEVVE